MAPPPLNQQPFKSIFEYNKLLGQSDTGQSEDDGYSTKGRAFVQVDRIKAAEQNNQYTGFVYDNYLTDKNKNAFESGLGIKPASFGLMPSVWMSLFSLLLGILMFLDLMGCLGRSNYANAVVSFSIYLAIYVDLIIDFNNEHVMARTALVLSLFAYIVLIFFDVWYLLFGSFVSPPLTQMDKRQALIRKSSLIKTCDYFTVIACVGLRVVLMLCTTNILFNLDSFDKMNTTWLFNSKAMERYELNASTVTQTGAGNAGQPAQPAGTPAAAPGGQPAAPGVRP